MAEKKSASALCKAGQHYKGKGQRAEGKGGKGKSRNGQKAEEEERGS